MTGRARRTSERERVVSQRHGAGAHSEWHRSRDIGEADRRAQRNEPKPTKRAASAGPKLRSSVSPDRRTLTVRVPLKLHKRGGRKLVVNPDGAVYLPRRAQIDNTLVKALARAYRWQQLLERGTYASIAEIARAEQINDSYVSRLLRLTLLAPEIVEGILDGRQASGLQIEALLKPMPVEWERQKALVDIGNVKDCNFK